MHGCCSACLQPGWVTFHASRPTLASGMPFCFVHFTLLPNWCLSSALISFLFRTVACDYLTYAVTIGFLSLIAKVRDLKSLWSVMALLSSCCSAQRRQDLIEVIEKASK
mmetsp:Transcript_15274/g.38580  ORF Transcript_15274/g.38580 Transcript_15274/m.38580 type:complete len:109 (-) Transcript_15274:197-523(-)